MQKNTPRYWFKRRRFGWGWTPVTWQGWATLIVWFILIVLAAFQLPTNPSSSQYTTFLAAVLAIVILLFVIIGLKSPRPHWRWGAKPSDNPDEDF